MCALPLRYGRKGDTDVLPLEEFDRYFTNSAIRSGTPPRRPIIIGFSSDHIGTGRIQGVARLQSAPGAPFRRHCRIRHNRYLRDRLHGFEHSCDSRRCRRTQHRVAADPRDAMSRTADQVQVLASITSSAMGPMAGDQRPPCPRLEVPKWISRGVACGRSTSFTVASLMMPRVPSLPTTTWQIDDAMIETVRQAEKVIASAVSS